MADRARFYTHAARGLLGAVIDVLCRAHTVRRTRLYCLLGWHEACPGWSAGRPVSEITHCACEHHYRLDHLDEARTP